MTGSVAARLSANLQVKGEITGSEDLVIEGTFEGLVQLNEGKLTIGTTAKVTVDIMAAEVVVSGNVKGNVRAKNRIEIKKDGSVTGDLTTPQILIEDGGLSYLITTEGLHDGNAVCSAPSLCGHTYVSRLIIYVLSYPRSTLRGSCLLTESPQTRAWAKA